MSENLQRTWPLRPVLLGLFVLLAALEETATAQAPGFDGETIAIEIGYGPGGGYDTYARVLAKHYGRHIPGNPIVLLNQKKRSE